jgi:hypothetical protein
MVQPGYCGNNLETTLSRLRCFNNVVRAGKRIFSYLPGVRLSASIFAIVRNLRS